MPSSNLIVISRPEATGAMTVVAPMNASLCQLREQKFASSAALELLLRRCIVKVATEQGLVTIMRISTKEEEIPKGGSGYVHVRSLALSPDGAEAPPVAPFLSRPCVLLISSPTLVAYSLSLVPLLLLLTPFTYGPPLLPLHPLQ